MASTQSPTQDRENHTQIVPAKKRLQAVLLLFLLIIIVALVGWQLLAARINNTDPTVAGRPLSNGETHLHTIAQGGKPGVLYLGTHFGLFTSTDGGHTWPQARGVLNDLMITTISVNLLRSSSLAVIGLPSTSASGKAGIYFSQDDGHTWDMRQPANLPPGAYPFTVCAGTASANHFYAFYLYAGWYETRDMGLHWGPITSSPLSDMQQPSLLTFAEHPQHLLLGGDKGLFESNDDGQHWDHLTMIDGAVLKLVAVRNMIFCVTDQALYKWQENGVATPTITRLSTPGNHPFDRIAVDTTGTTLYGLIGRDLWYSQDAGDHWVQHFHFDRGDLVTLLVNPQRSAQLYAGFFLPAKVLSSEDGGKTWRVLTA